MTQITTEAIKRVTTKLNELATDLDEEERAVLDLMAAKATEDEGAEVSGFNFGSLANYNFGSSSFNATRAQERLSTGLVGCDPDDAWCLVLDPESSQGGMPRA